MARAIRTWLRQAAKNIDVQRPAWAMSVSLPYAVVGLSLRIAARAVPGEGPWASSSARSHEAARSPLDVAVVNNSPADPHQRGCRPSVRPGTP